MKSCLLVFEHTLGRVTFKCNLGRLACLTVLIACALPGVAQARERFARSKVAAPRSVCPRAESKRAECLSIRVPTVAATSTDAVGPAFEGSGEEGGFSPADLRSAYKLPEAGGSGQTVAIVDAFDDPNANADLKTYREKYGLSACTEVSGCFKKVNQTGEAKNYPEANAEWSLEISLDLEMVSAVCPECHILLVEASTNVGNALYEADDEAVALGATEVSDSWGRTEFETEESYDKYLDHFGVPFTVAGGDNGYGVNYPAASPDVISVGGTALKKAPETSRGWTEEAWRNTEFAVGERGAGTGSGCSVYEKAKPSWQHDTGCARRTDNDVAAVASVSTPVSVYDSYGYAGWVDVGGTSVGAPLVAGIEAHTTASVRSARARVFYEHPGGIFDVTVGSDGSCSGSYLCTAGTGYDGPTGMGAPDGVPQIFLPAGGSTPAVVRNSSNKEQGVFYRDTAGEIAYWAYSEATGWENASLAGGVRSGTNPAATVDVAAGIVGVYYVNTSGEIAAWGNNGAWSHATLGGSVRSGTSPTATVDESTGDQAIYYVNMSGEIAYWFYSTGTGWVNGVLGGSVRTGTSPIVTIDQSTGDEEVYYVNTSGEVAAWGYAGSWSNAALGGSVRTGTNPAVAREFSGGEAVVYYVNTSGEIALRYYEGGWKGATLGGSVHEATSPSVVHDFGASHVSVDYTTTTNEVGYWVYASGSWSNGALGGETVQAGASPTVIIDQSTGNQWLYYTGEEDPTVWTWTYIGGVLNNTEL
jgi:hypothetical protein